MESLREKLFALQDIAYRDFAAPLIPNAERMIGVRLPQLRLLARQIARDKGGEWLTEMEHRHDPLCFEEVMLWGMVIGYTRLPIINRQQHTARFVPHITNWSVCDSFCPRLPKAERSAWWPFIQPCFQSRKPFEVRFAVITAMRNFTDEEHLDDLLRIYSTIRQTDYYVQTGIAWAVCEAFIHFPQRMLPWLSHDCPLPLETYRKALQKITESLRIDAPTRETIRALRSKVRK